MSKVYEDHFNYKIKLTYETYNTYNDWVTIEIFMKYGIVNFNFKVLVRNSNELKNDLANILVKDARVGHDTIYTQGYIDRNNDVVEFCSGIGGNYGDNIDIVNFYNFPFEMVKTMLIELHDKIN